MTYTIVLEEGDESWGAIVPDLPGLLIVADTRDEVIAKAPSAILDYLDTLRDLGKPIPQPGTLTAQIIVPAA